MISRVGLVVVIAFAMATLTPTASGDPGVAITVGSIAVDDSLKPGGQYVLPPFSVLNIGDRPQDYSILMSSSGDPDGRLPPPRWVEFEPASFTLEPGESQSVTIKVRLPGGAQPGDYITLVEARMVNSGGGVHGAVGAPLQFTVTESDWLQTLKRQINNAIDDASPWIYLLPILGLALATISAASRRVRFRLPFEPR